MEIDEKPSKIWKTEQKSTSDLIRFYDFVILVVHPVRRDRVIAPTVVRINLSIFENGKVE